MCGIFGVVDHSRLSVGAAWTRAELRWFDSLRDRLYRRGPDGAATWSESGVLLGHRRLSILDLSEAGAQPMVSSSGTVLVFNGEIYNYVELRSDLEAAGATFRSSGDTVVLLEALDRWGLQRTLARIRGMYAFVAWRPVERQLWMARDPVGKKPLFIGRHRGAVVFGSAVDPVLAWLAASGYRPQLDPVAINHALATGWVPATRTGLTGIEKLAAGTCLVIDAAGAERRQVFWSIPFPTSRVSLDVPTEAKLVDLFEQAINRRLRSDVPVATLLSGGLDSSLVTAAACRGNPSIVAYTAHTRHDNDDEFRLAGRIARHLKIEQRVIDIDAAALDGLDTLVAHYGEAFCDSSALPTAAICRAAGQHHRVVLTGDGGDEVQGGYIGAQLFALRALLWQGDRLEAQPGSLRRRAFSLLEDGSRRLRGGLPAWQFRLLRLIASPLQVLTLRDDGLDGSAALLNAGARIALGDDEWQTWLRRRVFEMNPPSAIDAQLGLDFSTYLADDLNVKVDVAAMASSVETRAPLLDVDFVTACWGVKTLDRVRPWARKRIIRMLANRYLPSHLLIQRKQGFSVPVGRWLATTGAGAAVLADLESGSTGLETVIDPREVLAVVDANRRTGRPSTELIWRLLVLSRWVRWVRANSADAAGWSRQL